MLAPRNDGQQLATPMMAQYFALKAKAGDCLLFYRMGDFFELFFDDAQAAAQILDIALTSRGEHGGAPIPMCGVPVHAAEGYLARLIKAGCRVAIAEQVETPEEARARGGSKALVARDIVRFVTAGTLTEEALLEPRRANVLAAICDVRGTIGIAACDISTGRMELEECATRQWARRWPGSEPANWSPRRSGNSLPKTRSPARAPISQSDEGRSAAEGAPRRRRRSMASAASPARCLARPAGCSPISTMSGAAPCLSCCPPVARSGAERLAMDEATRASLEILASQQGGRSGSLIAAIDRCVTGAGARQLAEDLSAPLTRCRAIDARLGAGASIFTTDPLLRADLRDRLRAAPDIGRALGRIVAGRGSPRDLGQVRDGLAEARQHAAEFWPGAASGRLCSTTLLPRLGGHGALIDLLARALVPSPPTERGQGGYIAEGYDAALDELRAASGNARRAIAALEAKYRDETGIAALKIRHNGVLGYFIEVPASYGDRLMARRQRLYPPSDHGQVRCVSIRCNCTRKPAGSPKRAAMHLSAEEAHFEELVGEVVDARERHCRHRCRARPDRRRGRPGRTRRRRKLVRARNHRGPLASTSTAGAIRWSKQRSPVRVSASSPMTASLAPENRLWLIGGPNMGGKSTFLRQNALIVLLAQAGGYVPAASATIGLVDRLFSRVGASDNLARGRSTFMVEMVETAAILAQASERSFVILDEVGRGTSTYDGLALAWAVVEAVHEDIRCRCLFATHYHELARLAETCDALSLHHVRAREWKGDLVLLHELAAGPADRSYGLAVARLAGVPTPVVTRAKVGARQARAGPRRNRRARRGTGRPATVRRCERGDAQAAG